MSKTKWIPGKFRVDEQPTAYQIVADDGHEVVLAETWDRAEADLFAAAPDLYEAAEGVLPFVSILSMQRDPVVLAALAALRAALAKARGETP